MKPIQDYTAKLVARKYIMEASNGRTVEYTRFYPDDGLFEAGVMEGSRMIWQDSKTYVVDYDTYQDIIDRTDKFVKEVVSKR